MDIADNSEEVYQLYNEEARGAEVIKDVWLYLIGLLIGVLFCIMAFLSYTHYLGQAFSCFILVCVFFKLCCDIADNYELLRDGKERPLGISETTAKIFKYAYVLFLVLTTLFLVIRIVNFFEKPLVTKFPDS